MPKITNIVFKKDRSKYWVYVDGVFCKSIRERTFPGLNLSIGDDVSCEKIKELENHYWKHTYGKLAWEKEKVRLEKVVSLIKSLDLRIVVDVVGFGAQSNEFISGHPEESGKPDIEVRTKAGQDLVLLVEVSGTEARRANDYWVRPDKMKYAQSHPDQDVWIVLHFQKPKEKFVFIKPDLQKKYKFSNVTIKEAEEHYVKFTDSDSEIVSEQVFAQHLKAKIDNIKTISCFG